MAPWIYAIPPNKAPKIQEEAGEAGCWRSQVTDFVDPSLGLRIPAPPVAAQPPARPTTPPWGAPFSPPFHQHPDSSAPQAVVLSWNCTQLRMRTPTSHSLPGPCPSQRPRGVRKEIKGTDGIDLRSEQDEFKTLKGRDRNRQDTIAVLLLSFVQWAVVDLENCSEKIPQGVDLRRLVIHNDHRVSGL